MGNWLVSFFTQSNDNLSQNQEEPKKKVENQNSKIGVEEQKQTNNNTSKKVCFGAGCYWGTENYLRNKFVKINPDIAISGKVGFMGA